MTAGIAMGPDVGHALISPEACPAEPQPADWEAVSAACVVTWLLRRAVSARELLDGATAFGLIERCPSEATALSARVLSRLFLARYLLPAHAEVGSLTALRDHLAARRHAFVRLGASPDIDDADAGRGVFRVANLSLEVADLNSIAPCVGTVSLRMPLSCFVERWSKEDKALLVASSGWDDLPGSGTRFFGGTRDADGSYHWDVADCDTDAEGHVVRC
jgi:hypothetical protein